MQEWFNANNIAPLDGDEWHWSSEASTIWGNTLAESFRKRGIQ
jgi:hypothetical protein